MPRTQQALPGLDVKGLKQALPKPLIDVLKELVRYKPILFSKSTKTTDIFALKNMDRRKALAGMKPKLTYIIPCPDFIGQLKPELTEVLKDISVQPGDRL
ncbi:hypothetical protein C0995_000752, partial [Termitomyces sp. Mi166